jgi:hypothetical protein
MKDDDLDNLLRRVGDEMPLPESFNRRVWLRIESDASVKPTLLAWLEKHLSLLTKPYPAAAAITAMIILGMGIGSGTAPQGQDLKSRYVESVSPFALDHVE